jgi:hypothetical protein
MYRRYLASATAALLLTGVCHADTDQASNSLARDLFEQLAGINTTESVGSVTAASEAMAQLLITAH